MTKPKGMQVKVGDDAEGPLIASLIFIARQNGFIPVRIPSVWHTDTFVEKAGEEILDQMYTFPDKKGRQLCLIPEVTAIIQELWKADWSKKMPKPTKLFYISRCYRYENVQAGRYREFIQFGVEVLGDTKDPDREAQELMELAQTMMKLTCKVDYEIYESVKRGLDYYVENGFEVEIPSLGAQKQVLGGGRYDCGIGFAIGVDRLLLANENA